MLVREMLAGFFKVF